MNENKINHSFETAKIEIIAVTDDIITLSWKPFPGEDDEFETYYLDN